MYHSKHNIFMKYKSINPRFIVIFSVVLVPLVLSALLVLGNRGHAQIQQGLPLRHFRVILGILQLVEYAGKLRDIDQC